MRVLDVHPALGSPPHLPRRVPEERRSLPDQLQGHTDVPWEGDQKAVLRGTRYHPV
eukprot:CAMPEP_0167798536 /NCGR_PEP_ID=MMETSP0111_2-20121227/16391_1 /TAXON_ID=91324 /ORGANISM="Lotharella globosa, Strain CCCM811" /LENGTH=55 /DNA_ID=CAMNT_0007693017 /DNA_START=210 /DNA_END=377 /DNA_ORIENTATION=-